MSEVVVTAVFHPVPGRHDDVRAALEGALPAVHAEEGCQLYALHAAADGTIVLIEKWESAELLDAHGAGEAVARLGAALDGLLEQPPAVTRMTALPAGDPEKGRL